MERGTLRVAVTVWNGRVAPVFDVSRVARVLTVTDGAVVARSDEDLERPTPALKLDRLLDLGVDTLICGAISRPLHCELTARGLEVVGFVAGEVEEVVAAFLAGALPTPALSMPGCCGRQRRLRGGGGGGGQDAERGGGRGAGRGPGRGRGGRGPGVR